MWVERTLRTPVRSVLASGLAVPNLILLLGACAAIAPAPLTTLQASTDRGRFYALRSCAGCHSVGSRGLGPDGHAPAFRNLDNRVAPGELPRRLGELSSGGHREMPPIYMSPDEIQDLAAYIVTLKPRALAGRPGKGRKI